jgi:hypothetical protein
LRNGALRELQTLSLATGKQLLIKTLLLDRFLACMKPASITLRQPCAGVFFYLFTFDKVSSTARSLDAVDF